MPTLSSLLVQHGVTSMRVVEEAIARQVLHGGDLATNVLELGAVRERELTVLLAESLGLPPAVGRLRPASAQVLRTIPVELAVRHNVFPLDLRTMLDAGAVGTSRPEETLVLATAEPLSRSLAEELSFSLGVSLRQLAAPLVRIRQALAEHYGIALERRLSRLVAQLDARLEGSAPEARAEDGALNERADESALRAVDHGAEGSAPEERVEESAPEGRVEESALEARAEDGALDERAEESAPRAVEQGADESAPARPEAFPSEASRAEDAERTGAAGEQAPLAGSQISIEEAPTVVASPTVFDEETAPATYLSLDEAVPTPRKPALHEFDDEPTVVAAHYPIELPPLTPTQRDASPTHEERTLQREAFTEHLTEPAPQHDHQLGESAEDALAEETVEEIPVQQQHVAPAHEGSAWTGEEGAPVHEGGAWTGEEGAPAHEGGAWTGEEGAPADAAVALSEDTSPDDGAGAALGSGPAPEWRRAELDEAPPPEPAEPTPRSEDLAPHLSRFAATGAVTAPEEASSPRSPGGARSSSSADHVLTGWLQRAARVHRSQHESSPPVDLAPERAPAPGPAVVEVPGRHESATGAPGTRSSGRAAGRTAPAAHRRKGPFTLAMAEQELAAVDSTEGVLSVVFDFAQQYFESTVLFTVQGDRALGRNGAGPGIERERVVNISLLLEGQGAAARARSLRAPLVTALSGAGADAELQRELGRAPHGADVAFIPIVVRGRVVALIYGDDGATSVELSNLGDLVALAGLAATMLERLILRKKLHRSGAPQQGQDPVAPARHGRSTRPAAPVEVVAAAPVGTAVAAPVGAAAAAPAGAAAAAPAGGAEAAMADLGETAAPSSEQGNDGALSARTRAALLELSSNVWAEMHGSPAGAPLPAGRVEPGVGGPLAEPQAERPSEGRAGIDEVARAFGLRGTGVEAEPMVPDEGLALSLSPMPPPRAPAPAPSPQHRIGWVDDPVSGTAVTAPMMPAAVSEIPDLEVPAAVAFAPSPEPPPDDFDDAQTQRISRPPWMLDGSIEAGPEELPAAAPVSGSWRPQGRHRTPTAIETVAAPLRPPPERRAGVSSWPAAGDLRAEYTSLLQHVLVGDEYAERSFAELVRSGETAISLIAARFPGPITVDRQRLRDLLAGPDGAASAAVPPASQCGPLLELIVAIRRPALPFMTVRSSSLDPEMRFWAAHVLGELPYPEAANALLPRLFDDNVNVRRIARRSAALLIAAPPAGNPILQGLDHITRDREESPARRLAAIETAAEIRAGTMVPALIGALTDVHDAIVEAACRALTLITREDHGRDVRRWASWWARNGERHRIEWIIDALTHEKPAMRRAAFDELQGITREYFGYHEDLPRPQREAAQERYRAWWISEGRSRFRLND